MNLNKGCWSRGAHIRLPVKTIFFTYFFVCFQRSCLTVQRRPAPPADAPPGFSLQYTSWRIFPAAPYPLPQIRRVFSLQSLPHLAVLRFTVLFLLPAFVLLQAVQQNHYQKPFPCLIYTYQINHQEHKPELFPQNRRHGLCWRLCR